MRQIKFRGRIKKQDGTTELFYQENQYLLSFLRRLSSLLIFEQSGKEREHEAYLEGDLESYLDRWTGLLDKNGKEIYEGDLVQSYKIEYPSRLEVKDKMYAVEWGLFGFTLRDPQNPEVQSLYLSPELLEVVGTVHENPELLTPSLE